MKEYTTEDTTEDWTEDRTGDMNVERLEHMTRQER
jgi:hypothetical protein